MKQHIDNILLWAADRGLLQNDPRVQCLKTMSEVGELADNIAKGRHHHAKDDIGDIYVTVVILCAQSGVDTPLLDDEEQCGWPGGGVVTDTIQLNAAVSAMGNSALQHSAVDVLAAAHWVLGCLYAVCDDLNTTLDECVAIAWDEIKDRKGKTVGGVFIKENDVGR